MLLAWRRIARKRGLFWSDGADPGLIAGTPGALHYLFLEFKHAGHQIDGGYGCLHEVHVTLAGRISRPVRLSRRLGNSGAREGRPKIGESEAIPIQGRVDLPLAGVRALGMGHVIAGGAMGRCLALYGADVLNVWGLHACEIDFLAWDAQVGMRSAILGDSAEDRAQFHKLLKETDIFFANKRPRYLEHRGLDAAELCALKPGLIHATVVLHGENGRWAVRPGFDVHGATVAGIYPLEGTPAEPRLAPIGTPVCDNVVGWLGVTGILAALRRRATEGGSYRVVVSLTRTALWLLTLGILDKEYAQATAGTSDEHFFPEPDLFTAETPCGTYQGMTDQVIMSKTPGSYRTVLVPMGSSKPEWLPAVREN